MLLRVRAGLTNPEIAQLRGCRVDTVKYHVANIIGKLEITDREALQRWSGTPLDDEPRPGLDLRAWEERRRMSSTKAGSTFTGVAPMFLVDDVAKTAEWYRDHLGFEIGEYFRAHHYHDDEGAVEPSLGEPVFVIVHRDGQRLMLGKTEERGQGVVSNYDFKKMSSDVHFWVRDIEAFYEQTRARGGTFLQGLELQPYGLRDFRMKDCDGRVLTFGGVPGE